VSSFTSLVEAARAGQARAVARLISLVEDDGPDLREVSAALSPLTGRARVLGLTGPPGVGKSTATSMLVSAFRSAGSRVGVLAIDPSSPFSGGALLGDRIRMHSHTVDTGVFIRSMATRGALGGLATATPAAVRVLDAAGFDVVLVETVGVGQSEVDIVGLADTTVVLLAPGMGDGIQAAKAGILEVADVFVVNKADRDGADQTVRDLNHAMSLGRRSLGPSWRQPIVRTVATRGEGGEELVAALTSHHEWLVTHGELESRRIRRATREIEAIAVASLRSRLGAVAGGEALAGLAKRVAAGETDPYEAADQLTNTL
jgi:LAO/AO transport system kinase